MTTLHLLLLLLRLLPVLSAQPTPSPAPSPTPFTPPEWALNRFSLASSAAPLTNSASVPSRVHALLRFITFVDTSVTEAATASRNASRDVVLTTCNDRDLEWRADVTTYFGLRAWPPPDMGCVTNVYGPHSADFATDQLYDLVRDWGNHVAANAVEMAASAGRRWEQATRGTDFVYNVRTQMCTHNYAAFVRLANVWYLESRITNQGKNFTLPEGERQYLWESLRANRDAMLAPAPVRVDGADGTTVYANLSGSVPASGFGTIFPADNIAVAEALSAGEHANQQASDATTTSNIAILALPLAMNLVPVALIADVNSVGMLVYTVATDVLTCVPLAIKGVEVLTAGLRQETVVVTRVTGLREGAKAAEVWTARCVANGELRPVGVALLVVAIVFMVGGVAAEFVAREVVAQRRRRAKVDAGPTDAVAAEGGALTVGAVGPKTE